MKKDIVKQISSGGFIFYRDKLSRVYVLLTKSMKDEYWIPKGKLEAGETQLQAAFREIKEEVGFDESQITYIDFCELFRYGYDLDESKRLEKDLYINVFEAREKYPPTPTDWNDLKSVEWWDYATALTLITFTKEQLQKAYGIFEKNSHAYEGVDQSKD